MEEEEGGRLEVGRLGRAGQREGVRNLFVDCVVDGWSLDSEVCSGLEERETSDGTLTVFRALFLLSLQRGLKQVIIGHHDAMLIIYRRQCTWCKTANLQVYLTDSDDLLSYYLADPYDPERVRKRRVSVKFRSRADAREREPGFCLAASPFDPRGLLKICTCQRKKKETRARGWEGDDLFLFATPSPRQQHRKEGPRAKRRLDDDDDL